MSKNTHFRSITMKIMRLKLAYPVIDYFLCSTILLNMPKR